MLWVHQLPACAGARQESTRGNGIRSPMLRHLQRGKLLLLSPLLLRPCRHYAFEGATRVVSPRHPNTVCTLTPLARRLLRWESTSSDAGKTRMARYAIRTPTTSGLRCTAARTSTLRRGRRAEFGAFLFVHSTFFCALTSGSGVWRFGMCTSACASRNSTSASTRTERHEPLPCSGP